VKKSLLILVLLLFVFSCSDTSVKDLKISKDNKDEIIEKVKKGKDLTGEEIGLLFGALARASISGKEFAEGKTVRDLINDQRRALEEEKGKEAEAKHLADEAKLKEEQISKELLKYIIAVPIKKLFKKANFYRGEIKDRIVIEFIFENKGDKDIKAFKGKTIFKNLFGEAIYDSPLYYDEGLKSKEKKRWIAGIDYNQFKETHNKLASTELENMKFEWIPVGIIFKDGSKLGID